MKVSELIDLLKQCPQDIEVVLPDYDYGDVFSISQCHFITEETVKHSSVPNAGGFVTFPFLLIEWS